MISKLAKSIAHFFVVQNITEESKEVIYAYGMELLISDVLNTIIVLLIALFSHTLPAVVVFIAVFMGLRQFVGGFHANSHLSCMFTLVMVMMVFSYGTGGSCAGGSYHISSECLLPLVRTTCRARRAEKLCKQEIIGNCVLQKGGMKWLRIRF